MARRSERKAPEQAGAEPRYRIGLVAKRTGVAAHTLRAWERRYRSLEPGRMAGGGRLYSDDDIARLKLLKQLTDKGHAIGSIATLPSAQLKTLLAETAAPDEPGLPLDLQAAEMVRERFLSAVESFDLSAAARVLSQATLLLPTRELVRDLLAPLLQEIGDRWERGKFTVAHEHAASNLLRTEIGTLLRNAANRESVRTLLAATLPGEQHEFGALLASLLASTHGLRVVYLGANLPIVDIARAAQESRAQLVLISIVNALDARSARELTELRAALPQSVEVCVGGRGAEVQRKVLGAKGIRHLRSFDQLETLLRG